MNVYNLLAGQYLQPQRYDWQRKIIHQGFGKHRVRALFTQ